MLDCPEAIQTSPLQTSVKVTVVEPAIASVNGPPAGGAASASCQWRSASAVAVAVALVLVRGERKDAAVLAPEGTAEA